MEFAPPLPLGVTGLFEVVDLHLAEDVAETVLFCANRPPHVKIHEVLIMPQDQAAVYASHPRGVS